MIRTVAFSPTLIRTVMLALLLALLLAGPGALHAEERVTGYQELTPELKAMQDDPFTNPGMLWVGEGEQLWNSTTEGNGQSCQSCHGGVESMTGVAPRYPAYDAAQGKVSDLSGKIQQCQIEHQERAPSPRDETF